MDRFIATTAKRFFAVFTNLKSSMDRFIVECICCNNFRNRDLKSSMDRFIDKEVYIDDDLAKFKIQYG